MTSNIALGHKSAPMPLVKFKRSVLFLRTRNKLYQVWCKSERGGSIFRGMPPLLRLHARAHVIRYPPYIQHSEDNFCAKFTPQHHLAHHGIPLKFSAYFTCALLKARARGDNAEWGREDPRADRCVMHSSFCASTDTKMSA